MTVTGRKPLEDPALEEVLSSMEQKAVERLTALGQSNERALFLLCLLEIDPELKSALQVVCELLPNRRPLR